MIEIEALTKRRGGRAVVSDDLPNPGRHVGLLIDDPAVDKHHDGGGA